MGIMTREEMIENLLFIQAACDMDSPEYLDDKDIGERCGEIAEALRTESEMEQSDG